MTVRLIVARTEDSAVHLAASRIEQALRDRPDARLGLAAGRTFAPVYDALAKAQPDMSRAIAVQLDEYAGLEIAHPAAFRGFLTRTLFDRLRHPPRTLLIDGAAPDPHHEISRHAAAIRQVGGIDLQLLGLGLNGYLAFNEPGSSPARGADVVALKPSTQAAARAAGLDPAPTHGLTLGLADILAARSVLLVVLGSHKAEILRRALGEPPSLDCPASWLTRHADMTIVADAGAAALLEQLPETADE